MYLYKGQYKIFIHKNNSNLITYEDVQLVTVKEEPQTRNRLN